jgi:hypothetical protein
VHLRLTLQPDEHHLQGTTIRAGEVLALETLGAVSEEAGRSGQQRDVYDYDGVPQRLRRTIRR